MCFSNEIGVGGGDFGGVQKRNGGRRKFEGTAENRLVEKIVWLLLPFGRLKGFRSCLDTDGNRDRVGICHGKWPDWVSAAKWERALI